MNPIIEKMYKLREGLKKNRYEYNESLNRLNWARREMDQYSLMLAGKITDFAFENVPFYKELYSKYGYEVGCIKSWKDFEYLPILTKEKLRNALNDGSIFACDQKRILVKASTTGSTGEPLTIFFDSDGMKKREINLERLNHLIGVKDKSFVYLWRKKDKSLIDKVFEVLGVRLKLSVLDVDDARKNAIDDDALFKMVKKIKKFDANVLRGYVSAIDSLSAFCSKNNIVVNFDQIITSAESLDENKWGEFERIFSCPVHNLYGGTETPALAINTTANHELSVFDDYYRIEIIEENDTKPLSKGIGRIIVTDYFMKAVPIIRYENGDLGEYADFDPDYPFRKLKQVYGRINDKFFLNNGKVVYSHIWHILFRDVPGLIRFQVVQESIDRISVSFEVRDQSVDFYDYLKELKVRVKNSLGEDVQVDWNIEDKLTISDSGKFRSVKSNVN